MNMVLEKVDQGIPVDPRRDTLLDGISPDARFVEVGASFRPLVPKRYGWNTCVVDHDTRENLVAKYSRSTVANEEIEDVDVVWQQGLLHESFPNEMLGTFDVLGRISCDGAHAQSDRVPRQCTTTG